MAQSTRGVIGTSLPGTIGASRQDQENIDLTVAGACAVGAYKPSECDKHTQAVRARGPK